MPIFTGSAADLVVEWADSTAQSADYTTDSVIFGLLSLSNMFDVLNSLESTGYWSQPTGNWPSGYGPYISTNTIIILTSLDILHILCLVYHSSIGQTGGTICYQF